MCLNPILRPSTTYRNEMLRNFGADVDNRFVYVPCGHCAQCIASRQNALVQRVEVESEYNHLFFATLTYDNAHLPVLSVEVPRSVSEAASAFSPDTPSLFSGEDYDERVDAAGFDVDPLLPKYDPQTGEIVYHNVSGESSLDFLDFEEVQFPYADMRHLQLLMKYIRNHDSEIESRKMRYLAVSELGKTYGRPHFHILFLLEKRDSDLDVHGRIRPDVRYDLEKRLWKCVFRGWSENVGTDKFPIYKQRFTYRRRFLGSEVHTNFDLHYVDPCQTTEGVCNVAYYVTKYMLKSSENEDRRYRFLRANLPDSYFNSVWSIIRCRMVISKGLGLNATMETRTSIDTERMPLYVYASIMNLDDLPDDDSWRATVSVSRRRVLVPDSRIVDKLHSECTRDAGLAPGPIYIDRQGVHRPLAHYYQRFSEIYSLFDFLDVYMNYDDSADVPAHERGLEYVRKQESDFEKRKKLVELHEDFDTSSALLWPTDQYDNNFHRVIS